MGHVTCEIPVELTFSVEASYTPGEPATGPTYSCGGTPAYGPEWDLEKITSITYSTRVLKGGKFEYVEHDLLDEIKDEEEKKVFLLTFIEAILGSKLEQDFGEKIMDAIEEEDGEPDYDPHDDQD